MFSTYLASAAFNLPGAYRYVAGTYLLVTGCFMDVVVRRISQERAMDKDRMKGSGTNMGGKAKEAAGNLAGDSKLQGEGKMDQAKGKVQNAVGSIKDALRK